jgi:hypothetical protein
VAHCACWPTGYRLAGDDIDTDGFEASHDD